MDGSGHPKYVDMKDRPLFHLFHLFHLFQGARAASRVGAEWKGISKGVARESFAAPKNEPTREQAGAWLERRHAGKARASEKEALSIGR